jgi:glycosyltransferase involved in cell wall biosynthesis
VLPHVTCAMITRDRFEMARASIACYLNQTYPQRDLLIVCESSPGERQTLAEYLATLRRPDIRMIHFPSGEHPLGALRNISFANAEGELVCQWDDDDLHHPDRISKQVDYMLEHECAACFLSDQLQYVARTRSLYWCDWRQASRVRRWAPCIPNTLLCKRESGVRYPETGAESQRSEDLYFMLGLFESQPVAILDGRGTLYLYITHGTNTWNEEHHLRIVRVTGLGVEELRRRRPALESALEQYLLEAGTVVRGQDDSVAFVFEPAPAFAARP